MTLTGMPLPVSSPTLAWPPPARNADAVARWQTLYAGTLADDTVPTSPEDGLRNSVRQAIGRDLAQVAARATIGAGGALAVTPEDSGLSESDAAAAQARATTLMEDGLGWLKLREAAEVAGALGQAYARVVWVPSLLDHPFVDVVSRLEAVPVWRYGLLAELTIHRVVRVDGQAVWRHLECHDVQAGTITHGLYVGTDEYLGTRQPLTALPATAALGDTVYAPTVNGRPVRTVFPIKGAGPDPTSPSSPEGIALFAGQEELMALVDATWRSVAREIRLSGMRVLAPADSVQKDVDGMALSGPEFRRAVARQMNGAPATGYDPLPELLTELDGIDPQNTNAITVFSPALRTADMLALIAALARTIVVESGFSPQTFGWDDTAATAAETATGRTILEGRTNDSVTEMRTRWTPQVSELVESLLAVDAAVFGRQTPVARPKVDWDSDETISLSEKATWLAAVAAAQAGDTAYLVSYAQPELSDEEVQEQAARIDAAKNLSVPFGIPGDNGAPAA